MAKERREKYQGGLEPNVNFRYQGGHFDTNGKSQGKPCGPVRSSDDAQQGPRPESRHEQKR